MSLLWGEHAPKYDLVWHSEYSASIQCEVKKSLELGRFFSLGIMQRMHNTRKTPKLNLIEGHVLHVVGNDLPHHLSKIH